MRSDVLFPFYEILKEDCQIGLYGAGPLGEEYYHQLSLSDHCKVAAWIDNCPGVYQNKMGVVSPREGLKQKLDYIIIAIKSEANAMDAKKRLISWGINEEKILWKSPIDLGPHICQDAFISKILDWKKQSVLSGECGWDEFFQDSLVLAEDFKRVHMGGRFLVRYWIVNNGAAYMNNAKVACTSIKAGITGKPMAGQAKLMCVYEYHEDQLQDMFKFTFVRNPYARLVSCFRNKIISHKKGDYFYSLWFTDLRYLMGYMNGISQFDEFIERICEIPMNWQEQHFCSQYDLLYKDGTCCVDYVGHFETLKQEYAEIQRKYGLFDLGHLNSSHEGKINWMDYYTTKTAELVYRKYQKDFEAFGYEDEYHRLMEYCRRKEEGR